MSSYHPYIPEVCTDHPWMFGAIAAGALGLTLTYLFRRWIAGGVCRSQARLDGKTVIITGANTGIGLETAVDLAKRNARVILACRSVERGEKAAVEVRKRSGNDNVMFRQLDLASLDSVRKFADKILEEEPRIDILINNAGVLYVTRSLTQNGFEIDFAVNHLGHFLLTNLLLDRIKEAPSARIVNVSSAAHSFGKIDFDNLNCEKAFSRWGAYGTSKLANILFTHSLAKYLKGTNVTVNSLHPGAVTSELGRNFVHPILVSCVLLYMVLLFSYYVVNKSVLILHLSICESGRSREGHLTRAKHFSFSSSLDLDVTYSSSLTQLAMVLAVKGGGTELDQKVALRAAAW